MKINVYTKEDMVKNIELNVSVVEFFVIQKALCIYAGNPDMPLEDRIVAVTISDAFNDKEQVELEDFNQKGESMTKFEYDIYKEYDKKTSAAAKGGMSFLEVLLLVFIILKLCKIINWSWWWVLSPIWIPIGLWLILLIVTISAHIIYNLKHK